MRPITRRDVGRLALAGAGLAFPASVRAAPINSNFRGVTVGVQEYSFRDRPLDASIEAMVAIGFGECEMNWMHMEPVELRKSREQLRQWRLTVPLIEFEKAGKKVRAAGIDPWAYTYNMKADFTEAEMARGFAMARALGCRAIVSSINVSVARRIDALAKKNKMPVALHNHSRIVADEVATPRDLYAATKDTSDYMRFCLDIGHFVAAGFNPIDFIRQNHSRILAIHVKDRKRGQGPNVPLGEGDTPIREVLQLIRDEKYAIKADIEYEYKGGETVAEVRKCFEYCKRALLS
ncbi:MAG TPA: sugar phosphate isomerase/epimerase [Bryobacteraceae bacterium]